MQLLLISIRIDGDGAGGGAIYNAEISDREAKNLAKLEARLTELLEMANV